MSLSVPVSHIQTALACLRASRQDGVQLISWESYKPYVRLLPEDLQVGSEDDQAKKLAALCEAINKINPSV